MKNLRILILAMMLVGARESIFAGEGDLSENPSRVDIDEKSESSNDENRFDFYTQELYEEYLDETKKLCPNESNGKYKLMIYLQMSKGNDDDSFVISLKKYDEQGLQNMLDYKLSSFDDKTEYMIVRYIYEIKSNLPEDASVLTSAIEQMADDIHQSKLSELIEFADYLLKSHENGEVVDWKLEAKRAQFHINPPTDKDDLEDVFLYQRDQKVRKMRGALRQCLSGLGARRHVDNEDLKELFSQDEEQCFQFMLDIIADYDRCSYIRLCDLRCPSDQEEASTIRYLLSALDLEIDPIFEEYKAKFKKMRQEETDAMWSDKSKAPKVSQDLDESDKIAMTRTYIRDDLYHFIFNEYIAVALSKELGKINEENKDNQLNINQISFNICNASQGTTIYYIKHGEAAKEHIDAFVKSYVMPKAEVFAKNYVENLKKS
ncbi:hypothetical protein FZC35_02625 [Candidatus Cytomitobacter indipagum]|uniref:Uncharacterized protein n=1 Tax=Candidatus Cytomitobacter indipagum TaxID=2601575 RepID=A0A5C0UDV8_9PROT|nr:hypothetical protein [Candidatus Cytomitobacter indipagum]QEK38246.1 hypothetical protein FZC35_02625 [Candidatus Cytomitobacter indipagum]